MWTTYDSPIGRLTLVASEHGVTGLRLPNLPGDPLEPAEHDPAALAAVSGQLDAYFAGELEAFDVALDLHGTPFQRAVWDQLLQVPYGTTTTYGTLAAAVGGPRHVRAVGAAVGRTPVPIIVPCHRVVGADGSLTGYGGGLPRKRALLDLEAGRPTDAFAQLALL